MPYFTTTRELIEMLQREDPDGDARPVINGRNIVTDVRMVNGNTVELTSRSSLVHPQQGPWPG